MQHDILALCIYIAQVHVFTIICKSNLLRASGLQNLLNVSYARKKGVSCMDARKRSFLHIKSTQNDTIHAIDTQYHEIWLSESLSESVSDELSRDQEASNKIDN